MDLQIEEKLPISKLRPQIYKTMIESKNVKYRTNKVRPRGLLSLIKKIISTRKYKITEKKHTAIAVSEATITIMKVKKAINI